MSTCSVRCAARSLANARQRARAAAAICLALLYAAVACYMRCGTARPTAGSGRTGGLCGARKLASCASLGNALQATMAAALTESCVDGQQGCARAGLAADAGGRRVGGLGGVGAPAAAAGRRAGRPDALHAERAVGGRGGRRRRQVRAAPRRRVQALRLCTRCLGRAGGPDARDCGCERTGCWICSARSFNAHAHGCG